MGWINGVSIYRVQWRQICILPARENAILAQVYEQAIPSFGKSNWSWQRLNSHWSKCVCWNAPLIYCLPRTCNLNVMQINLPLKSIHELQQQSDMQKLIRRFIIEFRIEFRLVLIIAWNPIRVWHKNSIQKLQDV